jgi:hypothetical protein
MGSTRPPFRAWHEADRLADMREFGAGIGTLVDAATPVSRSRRLDGVELVNPI